MHLRSPHQSSRDSALVNRAWGITCPTMCVCISRAAFAAALCLGLSVALRSPLSHAAFGIANPKQEQAILWPLLPGESLNSLAAKLYPHSPILQQRFVQHSLSLSRSRGILLNANQTADAAQLIAVPNAQTLHTLTHRIKKADEVDPQRFVAAGLAMSVQLTPVRQQNADWHIPRLSFTNITLPELAQLKDYSFSLANLTRRMTAVKTHVVETYQANAHAIARTPLNQLYQTPQLALSVLSAVLLLLLSVVWGVLEAQRTDQSVR